MRSSYVHLAATTPLAFRSHRDQHGQDTHDYLPGKTLRGALAAAHEVLRPQARDEFRLFFLGDDVLFGNGYPCQDGSKDGAGPGIQVRPMPTTAVTCKRCSGFAQAGRAPSGPTAHGVWDGLMPLALFVLGGQSDIRLLSSLDRCGSRVDGLKPCHSPAARMTGYLLSRLGEKGFRQARVTRELRTRNGVSRARGSVHQGVLYSREMLSRGTRLQVALHQSDRVGDSFLDFLREVEDAGLLRVGTNRSRGLGGLRLVEQGWRESPTVGGLEARLKQFNKRFQEQASRYKVRLPHAFYLPLTLESEAILRDDMFRHATCLDGGWFSGVTGIEGAELVFQSASVRRVSGWNALWGLPAEDDWAISWGSVFLLGLPGQPAGDQLKQLQRLETFGIGARRSEGFGRLCVAESFHLEVRES